MRPWRPTVALLVAAATIAVGLVLASLAHRGDLVVVVAPFAAALGAGLLRAPRPARDDERVSLELPSRSVWEGDDVPARVLLPDDPDVDVVLVALAHGNGVRAQRTGTLLSRVPGEALDVHFDATRWGRVSIGPVTTTLTAAHGLLRRSGPSGPSCLLTVLPLRGVFRAVDAVPQAAGLVGGHRSRRPGEGTDLLALRPFTPGDRIRRINWPVSLRTGALHVTTTTDDRDTEVQLVVDTSVEVGGADPSAATSLDVTVRSAASIAEFYLRSGDRVGLIDLGTPRRPVRLRGGRRHMMKVLTTLLDVAPPSTVLERGRGVRRLRDVPPRALVFVFSTLLDEGVAGHVGTLAMRGQSVLIIDTLPPDACPPYDHEWTDLAWRVALLRRDGLRRRLGGLGVPVVSWGGAGSLDQVLRGLSRSAAVPRLRPMSRRRRPVHTVDLSLDRLRLLATASRGALAIRAVLAALGVVAGAAVPGGNPLYVVLLVAAIVITVLAPDQTGAALVIGVSLLFWSVDLGVGNVVPTARVLTFALALYLVHETASLAATVPIRANVSGAVVWRWALGCLPGVVAAVFAAAVLNLIGRPGGAPVIDVIGVLAATAVVGSVLWMLRSLRSTR